ncbi:hypothetical protein JK358_11180 [Nocardia sp. 2]|uniref:Uncharacterized protein n=1 Tax=Nocardia acididurans TaxID=2802282 RepID=A0ABS1M4H9_9NOCA|nr:hypothetical protein [Nocardia acididurans]MBL1074955.1 hypothetical protein [Nocardia acididurans]
MTATACSSRSPGFCGATGISRPHTGNGRSIGSLTALLTIGSLAMLSFGVVGVLSLATLSITVGGRSNLVRSGRAFR